MKGLSLIALLLRDITDKQDNRGDIRKIHVTRQFFRAKGPEGHFFEKRKKCVFRYGLGEIV